MQGLLFFGDTERSAALRHEIPVGIVDPLLFAEVDGRRVVLTSWLERDRVTRALPGAEVLDFFALGWKELVEGGMSFAEADRETAIRAVQQIGIDEAIVPGDFPLALGDRLREGGIVVTVDDDAVQLRRRAKSVVELDGISAAQRAAEAGMTAARELLFRAGPTGDGHLELDGERLLAEDVRATLRAACAEHGAPCPPDVIVASVWNGSGHEPGSGPLPNGLPIVVDIWPREEASGCWADMTRTFVVGTPAPEHADLIAEHVRVVRTVFERVKAAKQRSVPASADASSSTSPATCSSRRASSRSERRSAKVSSKASSSRLGTASASRCTNRQPLVWRAGSARRRRCAGDRAGSLELADRRSASRGPRARDRARWADADTVSLRHRAGHVGRGGCSV